MYQVQSAYARYYKDYIDKNVREFQLVCTINNKEIPESQISSINIDYDLLSGEEEYTIGNLASAKLTMVVSSDVLVFSTNEINLTVKLKAQDNNNNIIWIPVPIGRFHVFNVSSTNLSRTITAYDDLYKTELESEYISKLEYPQNIHDILDEICGILDIDFHTDIPNDTINRPPIVNEVIKRDDGKLEIVESDSDRVCLGMTVGQALGYIASYLGGNFIVDGDARLKLINFPTSVSKSYDYTRFGEQVTGIASYSITGLECAIYEGNIIKVGTNYPNSVMSFDNPFMDRPRLLNILSEVENITYKQSKLRLKGDPTLQLGDLIQTYELNELGYQINKMTTPILRMTFSYTGGCTNTIESPCKAPAEKTINYKGTISSRLDNLENIVESTNSEIDKINSTLTSLKTVKDNMDDMSVLINNMPYEVGEAQYRQYTTQLQKILDSDTSFELKYAAVYNNKYL